MFGNENDNGLDDERCALVVQDHFTRWVDCYLAPTNSADDTKLALRNFMGAGREAARFYSDNSAEIIAAVKELKWLHDTSTPYRQME